MSFEITGKIIHLGNTVDVTDKFRKREFVISKTDTVSGNTYTEEIKFQTVQNNCGILDKVNVGDVVDVKFNIKGKKWKDDWFTNLDAWKVELNSESDDIPSANDSILGTDKSKGDKPKRVVATATNDDEDFFDDDDNDSDLPF